MSVKARRVCAVPPACAAAVASTRTGGAVYALLDGVAFTLLDGAAYKLNTAVPLRVGRLHLTHLPSTACRFLLVAVGAMLPSQMRGEGSVQLPSRSRSSLQWLDESYTGTLSCSKLTNVAPTPACSCSPVVTDANRTPGAPVVCG